MKVLILFLSVLCQVLGLIKGEGCNGMEGLCGLKFDQVTFPGTHNSGAGFDGVLRYGSGFPALSCFYRCQDMSYTGQLEYGVRFFDIDVCYQKNEMVNCHRNAYTGSIAKGFNQLADWLNRPENRNEVIAIRISDLKSVDAGNIHILLDEANAEFPGTGGKMGLNDDFRKKGSWPTLQAAINENKRVFIFVPPESDSILSIYPWAIQRDLYMKDTWQTRSMTTSCGGIVPDTQAKCKEFASSELILDSNFGSYGLCVDKMAKLCDDHLEDAASACYDERKKAGKTVNFIMVDYPEKSSGSQTVTAVAAEINKENIKRFA